jgi:hypothetical protein
MRWLVMFVLLTICVVPVFANHSTLRIDPFNTNPINTSGQPGANFSTQLREMLDHELAQTSGRSFQPYVFSGGTHGTAGGLTSSAFATEAFVPERVNQTSTAITYTGANNTTCWTIVSADNDGIASWTRVGTTGYYYQCETNGDTTATEPTLPPNSAWLMRVTIDATPAISAVTDRRTLSPNPNSGLSSWIRSGCAPAVPSPGSLAFASFACVGFIVDAGPLPHAYPVVQSAVAVTVPDSPTVWLALHRNTTDTPSGCGGGNWARVTGAHYLTCASATQPADPVGGIIFRRVTVAASVITLSDDFRRPASLALSNVFSVRDPLYGATGDGVIDDRGAIALAVAAVIAQGGHLFFPCGTYVTSSASPLVEISTTSASNIKLSGHHPTCTTLRQNGTGNGMNITFSGSGTIRVENFTLLGNDTAAMGIRSENCQGCIFDHLLLAGFLNHSHYITGVNNYLNTIRYGRTTAGVGALAAGRGVRIDAGNGNSVENHYFNIGGAGTRYETCLDAQGAGGVTSLRNWYDGCVTGVRTNTATTSFRDTFDTTAGMTLAFVQTANNLLAIHDMRISGAGCTSVYGCISFLGLDRRWLSVTNSVNNPELNIRGGVLQGNILTPPQITGAVNNYTPTGGEDSSVWRLSTNGAHSITGIAFGTAGKIIFVHNIGTQPIYFADQNSNSTAENRIITSRVTDEALLAGEWGLLIYDGTSSRWRFQRFFVPYVGVQVVSPAQITGNQNDYPTPGGSAFVNARVLRLTTDAPRNITGIDVTTFMDASTEDGYELRIVNVGSFDLVLTNQDALSLASNRIITGTGGSVTLAGNETANLMYDSTSFRWRMISRHP